ncbi:MAG TPA: aldehyde ferredoxin oxidoreductase family protein [Spirochaetia bacterium]|nr:aldehyde ferredoxin oxidoreductase family protein [Spirochaetia bacterium]
MHGFYGKILRVDLEGQTFREEPVKPGILEKYLGGKGLGSYLVLTEIAPGVDPLGPENKLIFTLGPATDTPVFGSSRYGVYAKSPLTGGYAESYSGGRVAPVMKRCGFDALILEGRARAPLFLEVTGEGVRFHSAADLWGLDAYTAEQEIKSRSQREGAQGLVIGPAGENLARIATLQNNRWRSAGRGGLGAVLGSKNVKGLVFWGQKKAGVFDEKGLAEFSRQFAAGCRDHAAVKNYRRMGTPMMVALLNSARAFPTAYWTKGELPGWLNISADTLLADFDVKPRSCSTCMLACGNLTTVREGKYKGLTIEGPEYETIYAFGGLCQIGRLDEIIHLNDLCDALGIDTISAGNMVALAMEARERGLKKDWPCFGDVDGAARFLEDIAYRRGDGRHFADGIVAAARAFGLEDRAVHVKGMEPPGYDPRVLKGMGLSYAVSARGACHLRATFYKQELAGVIAPDAIEGKAALYLEFEDRLTIFNTLILCVFYRDLYLWPQLQEIIRLITGVEYSELQLKKMAGDIITLTRLINLREGIGSTADTLPRRLLTEPLPEGGDRLTGKELSYMVSDYYRLRGWDEGGVPFRE